MPEKQVLVIMKSRPFTTLNYYEALRTAAGFWDHMVKFLWMGEGVYAALKNVDRSLTGKFLADLPDLDIEMYVDQASLERSGFTPDDLVDEVQLADTEMMVQLLEEAEHSFVF